MTGRQARTTVLAIYPFHRGIAYTLFGGPLSPIDWGTTRIRGDQKNARLFEAAQRLIDLHYPDVLLLEDHAAPARRSERSRRLQQLIIGCAQARTIDVQTFARKEVRECFKNLGAATRYEIAQAIASRIPGFDDRVPPIRKLWMREDERIGIFSAASLVVTFYCRPGEGLA
jgi:hypothetical protein